MINGLRNWLGYKVRIEWEDNNLDSNIYTLDEIDPALRLILLSTAKGGSWVNLQSISSIRLVGDLPIK